MHDGAGRYLLHLRDDRAGMWEPWVLALVGGKRSRDDASLEATLRRELAEETPGLVPGGPDAFRRPGGDDRRRPGGTHLRLRRALER
ncbi:NUDIX domain-containing protein [Streptomyces sp. NPDC059371]|uniref:NUDIX domain-containing protein n=1 Tax=Streptomyces sp. NPDC059371 TaxID=3346812 RepID=UPI003679DEC0